WITNAGDNSFWIYITVVPIAVGLAGLLLYIILKPFFISINDKKISDVPHGQAINISDLTSLDYQNIGISIDFSENDKNVIRHGILQGGKSATYTLIHIVETAGARYHKQNVMDLETLSDEENLKKYQEDLAALGYKCIYKIGYGTTS